jgi:hypothetical protein
MMDKAVRRAVAPAPARPPLPRACRACPPTTPVPDGSINYTEVLFRVRKRREAGVRVV